jgi:glycosyltransferase domain-containing protein
VANKLTIIVLVRNRQENLIRIVQNFQDLECRKIILDSSLHEKAKGLDLRNWEYVYKKDFTYWKKHYWVLENCSSDYILDCPDDDIVSVSFLGKALEFLKQNPTYSIYEGKPVEYKNKEFVSFFDSSHLAKTKENFYSNDFLIRFEHYWLSHKLWALNHCPMRFQAYKNVFSFIQRQNEYENVKLLDRLFWIFCLAAGNIKSVNHIGIVRATDSRLIEIYRNEFWDKHDFETVIKKNDTFLESISIALGSKPPLIVKEKIESIIREHLEKYHPPKKFSKQKKIFWPLSSECRNFKKLYELTNESLPISISRNENKP